MVRIFSALLVLSCCSQAAWLYAQEGKLQQVRDEVSGKTDDPAANPENKKKPAKEREEDDGLGDLFGTALGVALITPFSIPYDALHDDYHNDDYFLPYPYAEHQPGLLWIQRHDENGGLIDPVPENEWPWVKHWSVRLGVEESNDFNGINRVNGQLLMEAWRFGIQSNFSFLDERLPCGCHDQLALGDANLVFRFAENEWAQFRSGVGFRWLADDRASDFGFNFTYGADFFPVKPLVVSSVIDLGSLGSAFVVHGRATAGVLLQRWEFFAGYDFLRIGTVNLQGPTLGVRLWF